MGHQMAPGRAMARMPWFGAMRNVSGRVPLPEREIVTMGGAQLDPFSQPPLTVVVMWNMARGLGGD
jgi:hypothetical protein